MERKQLTGVPIKALSKKGEGQAVFATLNVIDKDGDVTENGAFGEQDVPMVPTHNWGSSPIGKAHIFEEKDEAIAEFKLNLDSPLGREWYAALKFDLDNPPPKQEYSYGYAVKEFNFGEFEDQPVRFLKKMKVHEVSPVLIGAGVNTRTLALKGADEGDPVINIVERAIAEEVMKGEKSRFNVTAALAEEAAVEQAVIYRILSRDLAPSRNFIKAVEKVLGVSVPSKPDVEVDNLSKAVPGHEALISDKTWDGTANERRVKAQEAPAYFRKIYGWQDPATNPEMKGSWKFIHHFVKSDGEPGEASIRACITGIAILNGARGGSTIPEADRRGVWNHLARHLEDADVSPPVLRSADDVSSKLSDQLTWLKWDVEALIERVTEIKEMRLKEQRHLPENRLEQILELNNMVKALDELLRKPSVDVKTVDALRRFNEMKRRSLEFDPLREKTSDGGAANT